MPAPLPASEAEGIAVGIRPNPDFGLEMSEAGARLTVRQAWPGRGKVAKTRHIVLIEFVNLVDVVWASTPVLSFSISLVESDWKLIRFHVHGGMVAESST